MERDFRVSAYEGGYNSNIRRTLDSISLPEWITCSQCGKRRSKTWFSKNALASLRQRIYRDGSAALSSSHMKSIRCTECASNPLQSERICKICGESKTLDGFARNQRKYQEPDWIMNNDAEFESRSKQHTLQRWDNHLQPDCGLEGSVPVQRRLLGAVDEDNDDNTSLPPPRLPQRRLLYHESMNQGAESSQSSAKLPDDNASNRATASKKPTKTAGDDETESKLSSTLVSTDGFLLNEYGSDEDTIVPAPEKSRTGWSKVRQ
ncbi:hypothetical protein PENSTE_c024G00346 [Penicillium steckii]|uniref:Stc1 domain-containing protein n=1 Tax=Penicillium steckii TaxID=303698 RepID=A0A1V6SR64_9EURO|nr:hypothetical protein PENSTE_c024G00346 [Penicillium steckii]